MKGLVARPYTATPCYSPAGRPVACGWGALAASLRPGVSCVAIDGPVVAGWAHLVNGLGKALDQRGFEPEFRDIGAWLLPWRRIEELTSSYELRDDPDFDRLASGRLSDLLRPPPHLEVPPGGLLVVYWPGAALVPHDVLWYADLPKRYAEAALVAGTGLNLGQRAGLWRARPSVCSLSTGPSSTVNATKSCRASNSGSICRTQIHLHFSTAPLSAPPWLKLLHAPFALAPPLTRHPGVATGRKGRLGRTRAQLTLRSATN